MGWVDLITFNSSVLIFLFDCLLLVDLRVGLVFIVCYFDDDGLGFG